MMENGITNDESSAIADFINQLNNYTWREFRTDGSVYLVTKWLNELHKGGVKPEFIKLTDRSIFYFNNDKII